MWKKNSEFLVEIVRLSKILFFFIFLNFLLPVSGQTKENFYWDSVSDFSEKNAFFPTALSDSHNAYIFFEETDKATQEIKIAFRQKEDDLEWSGTLYLPDSFKYSGAEVPDMYSAAVSSASSGENIAVSVLDSSSRNGILRVYFSGDHARTFSNYDFPPFQKQIASSRIFAKSGGGFILFVSLGEGKQSPTESSFSLLFSESPDGKTWSPPVVFKPAEQISNAFSPFYASLFGKDFVFFEGWAGSDMTTSMIYASSRVSEKSEWTEPFIVTDDSSLTDSSKSYLDFKNFRPFVLSDGGNAKIAWERTEKNGNTGTVMVAPLNSEGKITDKNDVEEMNSFGNGRRPEMFLFKGKFFILWFDDRNGVNNVHLCENLGVQWSEVSSFQMRLDSRKSAFFPCAVILPNKKSSLAVFWEESGSSPSREKIVMLSEDFTAKKPDFKARNFTVNQHSASKNPSVQVVFPNDASGIAGFSGIWTLDKDENPVLDALSPQFHASEGVISALVPEEGDEDVRLYFKAAVLDKAGNWSQVSTLEYYFDRTPPKKVTDVSFEKDEWGFALSNDVSFSWKPDAEDSDIAGYSWTLTRIAPLEKEYAVTKTKKLSFAPEEGETVLSGLIEKNEANFSKVKIPSAKIDSKNPVASFKNRDNGLYVLSVRAVDIVGNAGEAETCVAFLNKYKAATQIKSVTAETDDFGNVRIGISGDEFSYDGTITQVILTRNESGEKTVLENGKDFSVKKGSGESESISGLKIEGLRAGTYSVQIRHSVRGLTTWKKSLVVKENGTIKYEKSYNFDPVWKIVPFAPKEYVVDGEKILFWAVMLLIIFGILVSSRALVLTARDAVQIKNDVARIMAGEYSGEYMEKSDSKLRVRFSLRLKFGFSITGLLLLIVAGVALAIGYQMSKTQERILISGLKDRVKVVMGNMSSSVQSYLDDGREKLVEIGAIVNQTDNFAEAHYATILSYEIDGKLLNDGSSPMDYVWATNDESIIRKINSIDFDAGTVRFESGDTYYADKCEEINDSARNIVEDLSYTTGDNSALIFKKLNEFSAEEYNSYPEMSDEKLDRAVTEYYFYWPVIYQKGQNKDTFLQAMILMEVSTDTLIEQVDSSQRVIASIALFAAVIAALIGLFSAFSLSSIIVSPIRRIVSHVKKITDTENKLLLEGVEIKITSHDELRTLGDSVNDMTKGLVKGAKDEERAKVAFQRAAKDRELAARAQAEEAKARAESAEMSIMNLDGQAVQKAFIPLVSEGSEKETTASFKDKSLEIYGYYEGTDAVSGDYFDYKKLDERWYAFIKCDASGHGVPAALIMTIVATIFRRYFANWNFSKNGVKLNLLAADINDFIESLGLRGKFAAMMICLLDTKTGDVYTCNAGDNILRYFDSAEKKIKVITLHEAPAAGPLPSFMVEMKGGYKVEKIRLKPNDVLFLYTDGIEESTRFFRNKDFEIVPCDEPNLQDGEVHDTHKKGEKSEQLEPKRVQDIIESVLNRKKYTLVRYHAAEEGEKLEFDFTKCEGTIEEVITALTAVEKVFRMYKKPNSTGKVEKTTMDLDGKTKSVIQISGDGIKIDRKIDAFLKKYFSRYDYYCQNKTDEGETNYIYYTGVSEDVQADDLTLLAIRKM